MKPTIKENIRKQRGEGGGGQEDSDNINCG